ncbi:MAG: type II toxin-antitoxin system HicB family antitoxin [Chloroflexi bacterium]|nr:type II toxin-antitoxin system HicB family antitoxin [Chloroflexota bacterium]
MAETRKYTVILEPGEDGYVVAQCPALLGCWSQGRTDEEALANIQEAIELYVESLVANGEKIPQAEVRTVEVTL